METSSTPWLVATLIHACHINEREEILLGLSRAEARSSITMSLGRTPSTVTREVSANGGSANYRIWLAHVRASEDAERPKAAKLDESVLCANVTEWLEEFWSPKEITRRLVLDFPDDPSMRISHETNYQSLFVQGCGELRRELAWCPRSGRTKRRPQGFVEKRGKIPDMVMISERPAEIENRAVPGHWEVDLIIGANNASAVGTLVERSTRFVLVFHLGKDYSARAIEEAMRKAIEMLPTELMRSVTWDSQAQRCRTFVRSLWRPACPSTSSIHTRLAARFQREHQRPTSRVHAQGRRPFPTLTRGPRENSAKS
jgi:IS30 family transposase